MKTININAKLMMLIGGAFLLTAVSVIILVSHQQQKIIDTNQAVIYTDKLETIKGHLGRAYQRLHETQMVEAYENDFKRSVLGELRATYFGSKNQDVYPLIMDGEGAIVMHPELKRGDKTLSKTDFAKKAIRLKAGEFNSYYGRHLNWYIFDHFKAWNWIIGYEVPLNVKYANARKLRYTLVIVITVITLIVVMLVSLLITKFTRPISKLTAVARDIQAGALEKKAEVFSKDEIGELSIAFNDMTDQLRKTLKGLEAEVANRKKAEEALQKHRQNLEKMVNQRTAEIQTVNQELKTSEERFRELFDRMRSGVAVFEALDNGKDFVFRDFNRTAEKIEEIKKEKLIGKRVVEIFPGVKNFGLFDVFRRVWKTGEAEHYPASLYRDDRINGWRENYVFKLPSDEIVSVYDDVTEQIHAQEALKKAKEAAEAASIAKSEFLANMSHEIRTPMNGVVGMTSLLLGTDLNTEQIEFTETIRKSANSLMTVINDILDFSKIEAGKLDLEIIDFDLRVTFEEVSDLIAAKAFGKGLEFAYIIHHKVPSLLSGDPGRLRQVLINLIGNAIKFTRQGEILVRAELEEEDASRATIRFKVTDTGIGISEERMDRLFKSFSQVDGSTTRKYGGTGLGLAISKQLTELMGGEISVKSREGKGSKFCFTAVFEKQPEGREVEVIVPEDIRQKRILIVDDTDVNRRVLRELLKSWKCRFGEADGAGQALDELRKALKAGEPYEIAIIDMQMSEMDGEALGRKIKEDPELSSTVLVMLSSIGERGDTTRLRKIGFAAYLTKPIKQSQLYDCLTTVTGMQKEKHKEKDNVIVTRHLLAEEKKRRVRILLAEDDITNQKVALNILKKFGYRADAVANGREAVRALEMSPYDLVLMDVQMPEMDGFAATHEIRNSRPDIRKVPIIAMTAHAMKGDRKRCMDAGMDDYLTKPVNPQELLEKIETWLARKKERSSVEKAVLSESKSEDTLSETPPFDFEKALERAMGDQAFLEMLIGEFVKNLPDQIESLRDAAGNHDADALALQAHKLKGAAANLSADQISAAALRLEQMGRDGDLSASDQVFGELNEEFARLKRCVGQLGWAERL